MKLTELFPQGRKVEIQGKEYELVFSTRAVLQLERDYPDKTIEGKEITTDNQIAALIKRSMSKQGIKASDLVNFLYACLLNTKSFSDKEKLIDVIEPLHFTSYADAIVYAYLQKQLTPEQIEKLEVMAQSGDSKKKPESGILEQSTHSI